MIMLFKAHYGLWGLFIIVGMILVAFFRVPELNRWVTPIGWYGYILLIDSLVYKRNRQSLLMNHPKEFLFMLPVSVGLWCIFEWHNLYCHNWEYIGVYQNPWIALPGYAIAFSTILPAMIETDEWLRSLKRFRFHVSLKYYRPPGRIRLFLEIVLGLSLILIPCFYPSPYTGPLVWAGYLFVFAPLNYWLGIPGILRERDSGDFSGTFTLCITGLICGLVWESLNYWAGAKWIYHVPYGENIKIFEMPVLGFLGFIPFAVLFVEMYRFVRHVFGYALLMTSTTERKRAPASTGSR